MACSSDATSGASTRSATSSPGPRKFFVGIDGGGTKTSVVLVSQTREVVASCRTGSSNFNSVGEVKAVASLVDGVKQVLRDHAVEASELASVCVSLSGVGVDCAADQARVRGLLAPHLGVAPDRFLIHNDSLGALVAGTGGVLHGVVVICGTGTISVAVDRSGRWHSVSGLGPLLGDDGSGYDIGLRVLRAVCRALDSRGEQTSLASLVLAHLGARDKNDLVTWAYDESCRHEWGRIAVLSKIAASAAAAGDAVAAEILDEAAKHLAWNVRTLLERMGADGYDSTTPIVLAGGNFETDSELSSRVVAHLVKLGIQLPIKFPGRDFCAAQGAALVALRHADSDSLSSSSPSIPS